MFEYQTLPFDDSIRLLVLDPTPTLSARLTGSLLYTTWRECDRDLIDSYSALSYVWGKPEKTGEIWLDGFKHGITANLEAALRDIRDTSRPLRVWADAVCINQEDAEERHKQVALMGRIYTTARNTIIYLGQLTPQLRSLLTSASRINRKDEEESLKKLRDYADDDLLCREWFTRVWIFQELLLSKDPWIQCGQFRARWADLCTLILPSEREPTNYPSDHQYMLSPSSRPMLIKSEELRTPQFERFRDMERIRLGNRNNRPNLAECLRARRGCGVTHYQDMVYANLGIADDAADFTKTFPITYEKSWADVFTEAAIHLLHRHGFFSLCCHHMSVDADRTGAHAGDTLEKPSWVPDWRLRCIYQRGIYETIKRTQYWRYYETAPVRFFCDRSTATLWVNNEAEDTVKTVSDIIPKSLKPDYSDWKEIKEIYTVATKEWLDPSYNRNAGCVTQILCYWLEVLRKTHPDWLMTTDMVSSPKSQLFDVPAEWENPMLLGSKNELILFFLMDCLNPRETDPLLAGRRLATTSSGSVGFVPAGARPGDTIIYDSRYSYVPTGLFRRLEEKRGALDDSDVQKWVHNQNHSSGNERVHLDDANPFYSTGAENVYLGDVDHVVSIGECFFMNMGKVRDAERPGAVKGVVIH